MYDWAKGVYLVHKGVYLRPFPKEYQSHLNVKICCISLEASATERTHRTVCRIAEGANAFVIFARVILKLAFLHCQKSFVFLRKTCYAELFRLGAEEHCCQLVFQCTYLIIVSKLI